MIAIGGGRDSRCVVGLGRGQRVRSKVNCFGVHERRGDVKKFRERRSARWNGTSVCRWSEAVKPDVEERQEEGHALSLSPCPPASFSHPTYLSLPSSPTPIPRAAAKQDRWTESEQFHLRSRPTRSCQEDRSVYDELGAQCAATGPSSPSHRERKER